MLCHPNTMTSQVSYVFHIKSLWDHHVPMFSQSNLHEITIFLVFSKSNHHEIIIVQCISHHITMKSSFSYAFPTTSQWNLDFPMFFQSNHNKITIFPCFSDQITMKSKCSYAFPIKSTWKQNFPNAVPPKHNDITIFLCFSHQITMKSLFSWNFHINEIHRFKSTRARRCNRHRHLPGPRRQPHANRQGASHGFR